MAAKQILMCPPTYFDVKYEINAWMHKREPVNKAVAREQWQALHDIYDQTLGWEVHTLEPVEGLPDMVFITDTCTVLDGKVMLSRFRFPERQPEPAHVERWLREQGYTEIKQTKNIYEGGGDTKVCGNKLLVGHGFRSDLAAHDELRDYFDREVVSLKLIDPYFYHLDTALGVLDESTVAYYPGAFDDHSKELLKGAVSNLIEATLEEAKGFALNLISNGKLVITSNASPTLIEKYRSAGFIVHPTPILEFRKSGGGVDCMTLELR